MAAAVHIPVSEYLRTTYRPDRDYIDGEVQERNGGEQPHGNLQIILATIFRTNRLTGVCARLATRACRSPPRATASPT
jgi:hypothetical protein